VLTPSEIAAARDALSELTRDLATSPESRFTPGATESGKKGFRSGAYYERPAAKSGMSLEAGYDPIGRPIAEIEARVRKFWAFSQEAPVFQKMVSAGSRLHDVVRGLLGENPILFQEMALVKPAFVGSEKPWHQDNAYFSFAPLESILGVWLALDDAAVENGCMHVIPGGHRSGAFRHHHGSDCEIDRALLATDRAIPVPIPAGGALFFYGMLPHQTPPNTSPNRRRALQFHFRGAKTEQVEGAAYDALFVNRKGEPASCRSALAAGF
jgi:phytanoyl-CoA hydroxylase